MSAPSVLDRIVKKELQKDQVPFERPIADFVINLDNLLKLRGNPTHISSDSDWEIVAFIFKGWATLYPHEYKSFVEGQAKVKARKLNEKAVTREKGGAMIQHQLNLPTTFHSLLLKCFPNQKFDKGFTRRLASRMPILKVPDEL